ncbi:MAG: hypothetical protein R3C99_18300 [Pirellulaceae bacterium]
MSEGIATPLGFHRYALLMMALVSLTGMLMTVLLPAFASDVLHGGPQLYGFLNGASGVGALIVRLILGLAPNGLWFGSQNGMGDFTARSGYDRLLMVPNDPVVIGVSGNHMGIMLQMAACNTLLQTIVDEDKRGRVMSFYTMAFMGTAPLGSLLAGALADH